MSKADFDRLTTGKMSESAFQAQVTRDLIWAGFDPHLIYHTHISKRSQHGFPDIDAIRRSTDLLPPWVTYREPRHLVIELKTQKGTFTLDQVKRLSAYADLRDNGAHKIEVYAARPEDMQALRDVLLHGPGPGGLAQWPTGWDEDIVKARAVRAVDKKARPRVRRKRYVVTTTK